MSLRVAIILLISVLFAGLVAGHLAAQPSPAPDQQGASQSTNPTTSAPRATNPPPVGEAATPREDNSGTPRAYITYKTPYEFYLTGLTVALLIFMALLLSFMAWKRGISAEFLRAFVILTVVFAALFLIVAGYSDKQTAPVFSLLGTIIGYIFGRMAGQDGTPPEKDANPGPAPTSTRSSSTTVSS